MKLYKYSIIGTILTIAIVLFASTANNAQGDEQRSFTGTKKCKMCHMSEKSGAQFKSWSEGPHAKAYETLGSEEAKKIAAGMGIADPQKDEKCLKCHVTAYGVNEKFLDKGYKMEDGVSCESCHGAGGDYNSKKVMTDITMGKIDGATVGLVYPSEELCKTCHNEESPTYKEFVYAEKYKIIDHSYPDEYRKDKGYPDKKK